MNVGADIDTDVTIGIVQSRIRVAFLHVDTPAFDLFSHDMVGGDGVAGAVVTAQVAVLTVILDAEFSR